MTHTIENDRLTLEVSDRGAELYDLRSKAMPEAPLLWDGKPEFWARRAPVLFPWCMKIQDGWYEFEGKRYEAPAQHGFMRDVDHSFVGATADSLTFRYEHPGDDVWPWAFTFETVHTLRGNVVETVCTGTNRSDKPMPAQLGFHTALRCPFTPGKPLEDYFFRFQEPEAPKGGDILPIDLHTFEEHRTIRLDAPLKSRWIQVEEKGTGKYLRMGTENFPTVLLWRAPGEPDFVCIEPWQGGAAEGHDLTQRLGTVVLQSGESLSRTQLLTVGL